MVMTATEHPAKFSTPIMEHIAGVLDQYGWPKRIIDPFAGTGRVHDIAADRSYTVGVEIEPEWATIHPRTLVGNSLKLPFADNTFDGLLSSPCYGNRAADHHDAQDGSKRYTYRHSLGHPLHPDNAGQLQWGDDYRSFHDAVWTECLRVLQRDSLIAINVSNHIRAGVEQRVTEWHLGWFLDHDCYVVDLSTVPTRRMRNGANRTVRARWENVFVLRYVAAVSEPDAAEEEQACPAPQPPERPSLLDDAYTEDGLRSA